VHDCLLSFFFLIGFFAFYYGLVSQAYFPLAFAYCFWERRLLARAKKADYAPRVSVLVPAFNEERTIALSLQSILDSDYPDFEVIVINDGSTDGTEQALQPFIAAGKIRYQAKANGGKASALNVGIAQATGDIILFTDADSLFERHTIRNGVRYLADPSIGAVGGNDTPLNPRGLLQSLLVVTSHIGTGFVRRALSLARVLPIIPGNLGLVRTRILREIGGFREVWGEDLELTFRLHRHGIRIVYGARTKVLSECPHTLPALWKQRVRWIRSYAKVARLHGDMIARPRYGRFAFFLVMNIVNMLVMPVLQTVSLLILPFALYAGAFDLSGWEWIGYLGFGSLLLAAVTAIALDRAWRDLLYLPYLVALIPLNFFYNAVVLYSLWAESVLRAESWHKLERRDQAKLAVSAPNPWRRSLVLGGVAAAGLAMARPTLRTDLRLLLASDPGGGKLTVAIHFSDWTNWREAYQSLLLQPEASHVDAVAISAGRPDWTFYRWRQRQEWWSPEQLASDADMLEETVAALANRGYRTIAILDVLAPRYLEQHPQFAAQDMHGKSSGEVVCSTWLAEGEYGGLLEQALAELAASSKADGIGITELFYDHYCYDERCRASFARATGRVGWPRLANGHIDHRHPDVARWRSVQVAQVVKRLADIAHAHGKKMMVDVRVSRDALERNSRENGQDYDLLLPLVDQLVVWDYFAIDQLPPEETDNVAEYMSHYLGSERYWHSIGLWNGKGGSIDADQMYRAVRAARLGGARNIWLTPGKQLTRQHWQAIEKLKLGKGYAHEA
jgi:cellulose synthase/poly-beta-1,6-N-acetylglucosamine synthase-like glycosyltransferase